MALLKLIDESSALPPKPEAAGLSAQSYRPDIDGLRAIAILPVIFFHAGLGIFSGGFVGVDVFFVISGYLITTIIANDQTRGVFSILQFYERRIRRIIPALFVVVVSTFIAALIVMLPDQLVAFAKSVLSLVVFSSNLFFRRQHGYFLPEAQTIPLLHTWSLAVEEQFYAAFPIAMLLVRRFAASRFSLAFGLITIASLGISIWGVEHNPWAAFYLASPRAWELLLGSLLAFGSIPVIENRKLRNWLSLAGLGLIVFSVVAYSGRTPFPGLAAIPPTLGAAILIHTGASGDTWMRRQLSARPLVAIGLVSYSLYLWHWPLLVIVQIASPGPLDVASKCLLLALAAILATITYFFVERPFRRKQVFRGRFQLMSAALASAACIAGVSFFIIGNDGILTHLDTATRRDILANAGAKASWLYPYECQGNFQKILRPGDSVVYCPVPGAATGSTVLFWGDSEIEQLYPLVAEMVRDGSLPRKVIFATSGGCPPIVGLTRALAYYGCDAFNRRVLERAQQPDIDTIVLGGNLVPSLDLKQGSGYALCKAGDSCLPFRDQDDFLAYTNIQLHDQLRLLATAHKQVIVFLPFPTYGDISIPNNMTRTLLWGEAPSFGMTRLKHKANSEPIADLWATQAATVGAKVVDPADSLCPSTGAECLYQRDRVSLYKDGFHLTADGVKVLKPSLGKVLSPN